MSKWTSSGYGGLRKNKWGRYFEDSCFNGRLYDYYSLVDVVGKGLSEKGYIVSGSFDGLGLMCDATVYRGVGREYVVDLLRKQLQERREVLLSEADSYEKGMRRLYPRWDGAKFITVDRKDVKRINK